jgi:ubiquinone biosynthesis protein
VLLDKTVGTLASVGVELYPDFNVFEVAKPYARGLMVRRFTPRRVAARARRETYNLAQIALEAPYQVHDILEELRDGRIEVGFVHKGIEREVQKVTVALNRLAIALIVAGGLMGSSLIGILAQDGPEIVGLHFVSVLGFVLSGALGLWLIWGVVRSGRL